MKPCHQTLSPARRALYSLMLACVALLGGCAGAPPAPPPVAAPTQPAYAGLEIVNATLYQQTAAEYRALTRQVYDQAIAQLDVLLADSTQTAALEQQAPFDQKPPAVIVDIDETILDNAPFEARLVQSGKPFHQDDWSRWVFEAAAPPIPGAHEFVRACAARGIRVFYLSNRKDSEAEATRRNLWRLEFPYSDSLSNFLFRPDQRDDPMSTKGARRAAVAEEFRVLMLVGDNLGDFTEAFRGTLIQRAETVDVHRERFGRTWFMLPNAMYGSWEDALTEFNRDLDDPTRHTRKKAHLDPVGLGIEGQPMDK